MTAPIDGTVVQRHLGPGQWLGADTAEPAYTIADLSTVWLIGMAREADLPFLRLGQSLEVVVDALPGRRFKARITRLADAFNSRTRRLEVCAELQSAGGALKPGMQASLRITLAEAKPVIGVPASALLGVVERQPSGWFTGEDRIGLRQVRLGIRAGEEVEIVDGLRPGELIVTGGGLFLDRLRMA